MTRVVLCLIGTALAGCATVASPTPSATPPEVSTPGAAVETSPTPVAETAADLLDCEGGVSATGGRADDFGPSGSGSTPEEAFSSFLGEGPFPIPRAGYARLGAAGDRTVYAFRRGDDVKVVIVVSDRFGQVADAPFTVEEIRMCEVAEFGAADFGDGRRAWVNEATGDILTDIEAPAHCDWQSARMLHVEEDGQLARQYLRDPEGVFGFAKLLETYAEGVKLPGDAVDSGYRSPEGFELWFTASDTAAYVVTPDGVERWPRAEEPVGCS